MRKLLSMKSAVLVGLIAGFVALSGCETFNTKDAMPIGGKAVRHWPSNLLGEFELIPEEGKEKKPSEIGVGTNLVVFEEGKNSVVSIFGVIGFTQEELDRSRHPEYIHFKEDSLYYVNDSILKLVEELMTNMSEGELTYNDETRAQRIERMHPDGSLKKSFVYEQKGDRYYAGKELMAEFDLKNQKFVSHMRDGDTSEVEIRSRKWKDQLVINFQSEDVGNWNQMMFTCADSIMTMSYINPKKAYEILGLERSDFLPEDESKTPVVDITDEQFGQILDDKDGLAVFNKYRRLRGPENNSAWKIILVFLIIGTIGCYVYFDWKKK